MWLPARLSLAAGIEKMNAMSDTKRSRRIRSSPFTMTDQQLPSRWSIVSVRNKKLRTVLERSVRLWKQRSMRTKSLRDKPEDENFPTPRRETRDQNPWLDTRSFLLLATYGQCDLSSAEEALHTRLKEAKAGAEGARRLRTAARANVPCAPFPCLQVMECSL